MKIADIISVLEQKADPFYQESYDNAGLLTGSAGWDCTGVLVTLDATEAIVNEAIERKVNLIVAHHPIVFGGLKKINGKNYVEKTVIAAIKNDIAIYAIHTNLDNVADGVNGKIAEMLGLTNVSILLPKQNTLKKLYTFVPVAQAEDVRNAIFKAGGGHIGNYSECSYAAEGNGTFKAQEGTDPFVGKIGERHTEPELKLEVIFPAYLENAVVKAMKKAHPYEEVAYDVVSLANPNMQIGSGMIGDLAEPMDEKAFLAQIKSVFKVPVVKHTKLTDRKAKKVAVCGGAGSFLINKALASGADFYITADVKYHEFFDANDRMVLADVGHFESEQYTIELLYIILQQNFPNFAVLKTNLSTNPVRYFF
ncbi:Nif3-like dinuclear metal center hexameric protein [Pinibacter aurantiacus]|uniref:GTP cyclohydrolase 1 type 2 homolog n=1 Tax=Pinibacter aurantiacus TaxID=2851599 RepID=A0A9E2S8V3_9BACT|nr:Nif3-like dinuclear metal center hexameric protein [Pinibacter aurantiacus]MBV4357022.1 Nif3-like dinuclear metal center hexameric protein [Pinibacter aurantiacus]